MKSWEETAKYCEHTFGSFVDWEERFFICPECEEPIYECDWEGYGTDWNCCPVCETRFEEIE